MMVVHPSSVASFFAINIRDCHFLTAFLCSVIGLLFLVGVDWLLYRKKKKYPPSEKNTF